MNLARLGYLLEIRRNGTLITTAPLEEAEIEFASMGGCGAARFVFARGWNDAPLAERGDDLRLMVGGVAHWRGVATPVDQEISDEGSQALEGQGWWQWFRDHRPIAAGSGVDHLEFGIDAEPDPEVTGTTAFPAIRTAWALVQELLTNYAPGLPPGVSVAAVAPQIAAPSDPVTTKLGRFRVYANQSLAEVLEALATMDDAFVGVTAEGQLYFRQRTVIEGSVWLADTLGNSTASNRALPVALPYGGRRRREARPVTEVAVVGRDARQPPARGVRLYAHDTAEAPRRVTYVVPGIVSGAAARRYARGKLARFGWPGTRLVEVECQMGERPPEPWRGLFRLFEPDGVTVAGEGIIATARVRYGQDGILGTITLSDLAEQPGSGDPANDPFAANAAFDDAALVDVGDSFLIDFDDGFGGDGDDLHTNPLLERPGDGGLDYGTDLANPSNNGATGGAREVALALITNKPAANRYDITILDRVSLATTAETYTSVEAKPLDTSALLVGDVVQVFWTLPATGAKPWILSVASGSAGTFIHLYASAAATFGA